MVTWLFLAVYIGPWLMGVCLSPPVRKGKYPLIQDPSEDETDLRLVPAYVYPSLCFFPKVMGAGRLLFLTELLEK